MNRAAIIDAIRAEAAEVGALKVSLPSIRDRLGLTVRGFTLASGGASFAELVHEATRKRHPIKLTRTARAPHPEIRREVLLEAAVQAAQTVGADGVRASHIAELAGVSDTLVKHYLYPLAVMQRALVTEAIRRDDPVLLSRLLTNAASANAPADLRRRAAEVLANGREN